jgi:tetratricopeptide (TPR) repeat protein
MEHLSDQPGSTDQQPKQAQYHFDIEPAIEQRSFEQPAVQQFFTEWCNANDSIRPAYVSREVWDEKVAEGGILAEQPASDGKRELLIPTDLRLEEMVGVMEAVDRDTFRDDPERAAAHADKLQELGRTFADAGSYIAQRLDAIQDPGAPRELAQHLAGQFYDYGQALQTGHRGEATPIEAIASQPELPAERLEEIDRWLAGDKLYEARHARALADGDNSPEAVEEMRRQTLDQFFRTSAKAFELQQDDSELKSAGGLRPWQSDRPVHAAFTQTIEGQIGREIEAPKQELASAIFRRGMDLLQSKIGISSLPDFFKASIRHWEEGEPTLREALNIDQLRAELEQTREGNVSDIELSFDFAKECDKLAYRHWDAADNHAMAVGRVGRDYDATPDVMRDLNPIAKLDRVAALGILTDEEVAKLRADFTLERAIVSKERQVADIIQKAVSRYTYKTGAARPADIVSGDEELKEQLNCVGFSTLGGALMQEAGLNYLVAHMPTHSALIQVLSDGTLEWRDMQTLPRDNQLLDDRDVVEFSRHPSNQSLTMEVPLEIYRTGAESYRKTPTIRVLQPESGQQLQVADWVGGMFAELGRYDAGREAFQQALAIDPENPLVLRNLGIIFERLGRSEDAIDNYQKAVAVDPEFFAAYLSLGVSFSHLNRQEDAAGSYQRAIMLNPEYAPVYYDLGFVLEKLNRTEAALAAYESFLTRVDPADAEELPFINQAKESVARLKRTSA